MMSNEDGMIDRTMSVSSEQKVNEMNEMNDNGSKSRNYRHVAPLYLYMARGDFSTVLLYILRTMFRHLPGLRKDDNKPVRHVNNTTLPA